MTPSLSQSSDDAPEAHVSAPSFSARSLFGRPFTWLWLVTAASLVVAIWLVARSWQARGPQITVTFAHGHSIRPGDRLRHRGIEVGEVTGVVLEEDLSGVRIRVALEPNATGLAREGSQFWIERPQVSLTRVSGLETIVGGQYLAVLPGPADAPRRMQFEGLEAPPVGELAEGGLEILLEADQLGGLHPRAPVTYRGVQVGRIIAVGLATDAATVTAQAFIEPVYAKLIRGNTQFWRKSGLDVSVGLSGVQFEVEPLSSVAIGGVSFATADPPGEPVKTGHSFILHDEPDKSWLTWRPRIPVGSDQLPDGLSLPRPLRVSLRWRARSFGIRRNRQRHGWVLPLEGGRLLGPGDLLAPTLAGVKTATLEVAGREISIKTASEASSTETGRTVSQVAVLEIGRDLDSVNEWPLARIRSPAAPEDCLIVGATDKSVTPIAATRFIARNAHWQIDPELVLNPAEHHGTCVIAVRDGSLIGITVVQGDEVHVSLVTEQLASKLDP
jgi:hypothetical protein